MYKTNDGLARMRRVLVAYGARNPRVGYCQSMNYIAGFLLLFQGEEQCFWTMAAIIEELLPGYHRYVTGTATHGWVKLEFVLPLTTHLRLISPCSGNADLIEVEKEQNVIVDLLRLRMPALWEHIYSIDNGFDDPKFDFALFKNACLPWLLSLFTNDLPRETVLRVWDCFFFEGPKVIFRVALGLCKMFEEKLMKFDDNTMMMQFMKTGR